jgi:hypothetical protein
MLYAPSVGVHAAGLRSRCLGDRPSGLTITFCTVIFGLALLFSSSLWAQEETDTPKPVPILSAGTAFVTNFESGSPHLNPLIAPVMLIPIGRRWLIESRATFESDLSQPSGSSEFHGEVEKGVDYAQLDYIANRFLTISAGRFLTPFNIYNERYYPVWIRNLQSDPLILPIGVGPSNASTGIMTRGGFSMNQKVELNYAAYFSTLITVSPMDSSRFAGGRIGLYLPEQRIELGSSFQHLLQDERSNAFGFYFAWQPPPVPLDVRGEYARSNQGSGYWIESAYRLSQIPVWRDVLRKTQVVARVQQFFTGTVTNDTLPPVNKQVFEFGLNYYFHDNFRAVSSYGRQFSSQGNESVWTAGFTYRFVLPMLPGASN